MRTILLVDDEMQILKALGRILDDTDYSILTAVDGWEALDILSKNPVDMVISDVRMPSMNGCELLEKVRTMYPGIIRVILSGYMERDIIPRAMEDGLAKLYILKPWDVDELLGNINMLFDEKDR
ncbi:MAG: response regulator [Clostridiales bacterium]|nr:response regulator [Clostridiales bacterium]